MKELVKRQKESSGEVNLYVEQGRVVMVLDHFLLLRGQHPPIEVVRVDGRHEHDPVSIEVVLGEIGTVPHLHLPVLIEPDQGLIDGKGSKPPVEPIEAN